MQSAYIVGAKRSIVSPINGPLSSLKINELAAPVINNLIETSGIKFDDVDELIVSNALGAGVILRDQFLQVNCQKELLVLALTANV